MIQNVQKLSNFILWSESSLDINLIILKSISLSWYQLMRKTFVNRIIFDHFIEILFSKNMPNMAYHRTIQHLHTKIHWNLADTLWNSTTFFMLLKSVFSTQYDLSYFFGEVPILNFNFQIVIVTWVKITETNLKNEIRDGYFYKSEVGPNVLICAINYKILRTKKNRR